MQNAQKVENMLELGKFSAQSECSDEKNLRGHILSVTKFAEAEIQIFYGIYCRYRKHQKCGTLVLYTHHEMWGFPV